MAAAQPARKLYDAQAKRYTIPNAEEFLKLERPTAAAYKNLALDEEECLYQGQPIKVKGNSIHPASATRIKKRFPDLNFDAPIAYAVPDPPVTERAIQLPGTVNALIEFYDSVFIRNNNKMRFDRPSSFIGGWLSFFCIYSTEFCTYYDEYLTNHDEIVKFLDDHRTFFENNYICTEQAQPFTVADVKATCHIILISMNKTFITTADRERQIRTYLENRKSAVFSAMNCPMGKLLVKDDFFIDLSEQFRMLPKLKKMLFNFTFYNRDLPEFSKK